MTVELSLIVDGLDNVAERQSVEDRSVNVTMTVEAQDKTAADADAQDAMAAIENLGGEAEELSFLNISIEKEVVKDGRTESTEPITETDSVITVAIPFNMTGRYWYQVMMYRNHGSAMNPMTRYHGNGAPSGAYADGSFYIDLIGNMLYLYTNRFSTYAIGIDPEANEPAPTPTPTPTPVTPTINPGRGSSGSYSSGGSSSGVSGVRNDVSITPATPTTPTTSGTSGTSSFSDVAANAWYAPAVNWVAEKKAMSGWKSATEDGRWMFDPQGDTSRAMIAQILWNLEGNPTASAEGGFVDVADTAWYAPAIRWTAYSGIVTGYDNANGPGKVFDPNVSVTREQLAAMLYRYAKSKGIDVSADQDGKALTYNDASSISEYAVPAMRWAVGTGLITGRTSATLEPKGTATRAEIATIMMRYCTEAAK